MLLPGDMCGGRWNSASDQDLIKMAFEADGITLSSAEAIEQMGRLMFPTVYQGFKQGGYPITLAAAGDHDVGDNPWGGPGDWNLKYNEINRWRVSYGEVFLSEISGSGSHVLPGVSVKAPSEALNRFDLTSFYYVHKNVLFVTVDQFHKDGSGVYGDMRSDLLTWFNSTLKAGRASPEVRFIVVQGHLPVFYPVRKFSSSGMLTENAEGSEVTHLCPMLEAMRSNSVDLFLVGDVHHNTVTKDKVSNLVQFVHRGNAASNVAVFNVSDQDISITHYRDDGLVLGSLTISKPLGSDTSTVTGSGVLNPIDQAGIVLHFAFETVGRQDTHQTSIPFWKGKRGFNKNADHIAPTTLHHNDGSFGSEYSLFGNGTLQDTDGVFGSAIKFQSGQHGYLSSGNGLMSPMNSGYPRTLAMWVKTTSTGNRLMFQNCKSNQGFNLGLMDGKFTLEFWPGRYVRTTYASANDGQWHHVAVSVKTQSAPVNEFDLYVDGQVRTVEYSDDNMKNEVIATWQTVWPSFSSWPTRSNWCCSSWQPYFGSIDDFTMWMRGLTSSEVLAVYSGRATNKNALQVEASLR